MIKLNKRSNNKNLKNIKNLIGKNIKRKWNIETAIEITLNTKLTTKITTKTNINHNLTTINKDPSINNEHNSVKQAEIKSSSKNNKRSNSLETRADKIKEIIYNKQHLKNIEASFPSLKNKLIPLGKQNNISSKKCIYNHFKVKRSCCDFILYLKFSYV